MTKEETKLAVVAAILAALVFWKKDEIQLMVTDVLSGWKASKNAEKYLPALNAAEERYGIPRDLLARMAYQESRFRDDIVTGALKSPAGAVGIMQIVPKYHPGVNPLNVGQSIEYAARFLKQLYNQFNGDWKWAVAAYNWGPGNVSKYLAKQIPSMPSETQKYVSQIFTDVPVVKV